MQEVTLPAQLGRPSGSRSSRRLRAEGLVPGVLYGHGKEPVSVAVNRRTLQSALSTDAGLNALITLEIDGRRETAMARQLQRHPTRGEIIHLDFVAVSAHEVVTADVPIHLVGEAEEVRRADGVVEQVLYTLSIKARASAIPNEIEVDVSELTVGHTVRVADLQLPDGVECEVDGEEPVVTASVQVSIEDEEAAAAAAAEAEGVEGGAPAAEAAADAAAGAQRDGGDREG